MSYEEILNRNELTRETEIDDKRSSNEEKSNDMKVKEEEKLQKPLQKPMTYTEPGNKENKHAVNEDNNSLKKDQSRIDLGSKRDYQLLF